jgi:hypothetical protein
MKRHITLLFCLLASLSGPAMAAGKATIIERVGLAQDIKSGELLYSEHHREKWDDDTLVSSEVQYRDAEDRLFAAKRLEFNGRPLMPDFELRNQSTGHVESATRTDEALQVLFRHPEKDNRQFVLDDYPEDGVIDAGFNRWVELNWDAIVAGRTLTRPFLVPSLGKFVDFSIRERGVSEEDGRRVRLLRMEPASFVLRLAVDPIEVVYLADEPRLIRYLGVSNMRDARGRNQNVRIDFPEAQFRRYAADVASAPPDNNEEPRSITSP